MAGPSIISLHSLSRINPVLAALFFALHINFLFALHSPTHFEMQHAFNQIIYEITKKKTPS